MEENAIYRRISQTRDLINKNTQRKAELEKQIEELDHLKSKITCLQSEFELKQSERKRVLSKIAERNIPINAVEKYYSGMSNFLNGQEYRSAYNGLGSATSSVIRKSQQLQEEYERVCCEIRNCQNTMNHLNRELKTIHKK